MRKRASLNLSIQVIVIVVIAFVVLGLGLGFVRSQFGSIESTSTAVQEQISQQILDDLRTGNKKLSFPATTISLETGEESVQAVGVKNTRDSTQFLQLGFEVKAGEIFAPFSSEVENSFTTTSGIEAVAKVVWDDSILEFKPGESRVIPITITAPDRTGSYLFKVKVNVVNQDTEELVEEFDSRTFFIKTS